MKNIIELLSNKKFDLHNEKVLQQQIEECLIKVGLEFKREVSLSHKDIIDFVVSVNGETIGLEVKISGNAKSIYKQCERYCKHPIDAIVLVTNKTIRLPEKINMKPTGIVKLGRAWL